MENKKTAAFFGHREMDTDIAEALMDAIQTAIEQYQVKTFLCGNKGAFDRLAARTVFQMKNKYPNIEIIYVRAYLPKWGEQLPQYYTDSIYPEGLESVPKRFAIQKRNRWMAKKCDLAITYINHDWGGAYQSYRIVISEKKVCFNLGTYQPDQF